MPSSVPRFSVVICTYNRRDIVVEAIDVVLAQSFRDFELIVIDDGSADDTYEVCSAIDDPRLHVITQPNGGLSAARNTGLAAARGSFVVFLDDDDRARPTWLERLDATVESGADPERVGVVSCGAQCVDPTGAEHAIRLPDTKPPAFSSRNARVLLLAGCFAVRREIYDAIGGYEESILTSHQTELALRLLPYCDEHGYSVESTPETLVVIEKRPIADRPLNQPAELLDSVEFILDRHHDRLERCRPTQGSYRSVAGVSAAQIGQLPRARRHLWRAVRAHPTPRHMARLAMSMLPGADRHWRRHWSADSSA